MYLPCNCQPIGISEIIVKIGNIENQIASLSIEHNLSNYDIWTETGRSEAEQQEFKKELINYYNRKPWVFDFVNKGKLKCMATDQWLDKSLIIACHIWKSSMHGDGLTKFGLERQDAISPRNGFLMLKDIERQFDRKHLCIVYDSLNKWFKFKVLDPALFGVVIGNSNPKLTFANIDNTKLRHPDNNNIPFRRLLSWHARCSFKFAKEKEWITEEIERDYEPYHNLSDGASVPDIDIQING